MKNNNNKVPLVQAGRGLFFVAMIAHCLLLSGCAKITQLHGLPSEDLQALYQAAIEDAKTAEPDEIITTLIPITDYNPALNWNNGRVLLTNWTNYDGFDHKLGQAITLQQDVWVTVPHELQQTCIEWRLAGDELDLRLRQLLGLPPNAPYTRIVALWVSPEDLFRPSPDPEITDQEAGIDYPQSQKYVSISSTHKKWMTQLHAASYLENGYPWTRLGYTYDWGNPETEVGLSEFVIRKGAQVVIQSSASTNLFCGPEKKADQ